MYTGATPLGPLGYTGANHSLNHPQCCIETAQPRPPHQDGPHQGGSHQDGWHQGGSRRSGHSQYPVGSAIYGVPYPVYITGQPEEEPAAEDSEQEQMSPADYAPGPTIFDRRGSSQSSAAAEAAYAERMDQQQAAAPVESAAPEAMAAPADPEPVAEQPRTVLVFRDGHQLEVQNYAIVGATLFDVTPGHRGKIALAELDLAATAKENDNRGIDFHLPNGPSSN
jgi:hypothetical protein